MDYRKPAVFGANWSSSRYRVLPYFAWERPIIGRAQRLLDLGCAAGWNMSRFRQYGARPIGLDVNRETVRHALRWGPAVAGSGLRLPFPADIFDVIYVQHVLHHIGDVAQSLREIRRCLQPGGVLFLIETVEDNPIIRHGRNRHQSWLGDAITARFTRAELTAVVQAEGFAVEHVEGYSVLFWLWEIMPDHIPALEALTPAFVWLEERVRARRLHQAAHVFLVARKEAA